MDGWFTFATTYLAFTNSIHVFSTNLTFPSSSSISESMLAYSRNVSSEPRRLTSIANRRESMFLAYQPLMHNSISAISAPFSIGVCCLVNYPPLKGGGLQGIDLEFFLLQCRWFRSEHVLNQSLQLHKRLFPMFHRYFSKCFLEQSCVYLLRH